jgi:hypothetical protein
MHENLRVFSLVIPKIFSRIEILKGRERFAFEAIAQSARF